MKKTNFKVCMELSSERFSELVIDYADEICSVEKIEEATLAEKNTKSAKRSSPKRGAKLFQHSKIKVGVVKPTVYADEQVRDLVRPGITRAELAGKVCAANSGMSRKSAEARVSHAYQRGVIDLAG